MIPKLRNQDAAFDSFVDDPMFRIDSPRPVTPERVPQWLRLPDPAVRIAQDIFD
jgi:hypothetical protein